MAPGSSTGRVLVPIAVAILALTWAVGASVPARGQQDAPGVAIGGRAGAAIAVIDVQGVLRNSLAARSIQEQIDGRRTDYQAQAAEEERALREAEQDLARKRAILEQEAYQREARAFQTRVAEVQRQFQARKRGLSQAFDAAMGEVRQRMIGIVAEVAEERGYQVVLFKSQIVIAAKDLEITEEVRDRLDAVLPRVEVDLPPME